VDEGKQELIAERFEGNKRSDCDGRMVLGVQPLIGTAQIEKAKAVRSPKPRPCRLRNLRIRFAQRREKRYFSRCAIEFANTISQYSLR